MDKPKEEELGWNNNTFNYYWDYYILKYIELTFKIKEAIYSIFNIKTEFITLEELNRRLENNK